MSCAGSDGELDDLEVAEQLARSCYELYRRVPAGLAPEIAVFLPPGVPWPKEHSPDIGGGDFFVKSQVRVLVLHACLHVDDAWRHTCTCVVSIDANG